MNDQKVGNRNVCTSSSSEMLGAFFMCPLIESTLHKSQGHHIKNDALKEFLQEFLRKFEPVR